MATAKSGTKTTRYEYNADGLRTRKTNADGTYADYYWVGSTLLAEVQYGANGAFIRTLMFLHDEKGTIVGVGVKNAGDARFTHYYYAKNLQGDVVAVYRSDYNSTSQTYYPTLVASYEYDPWGKVISVKGSSGAILSLEAYPNHIAHVNPIRYRGYYYDNETGFYYLQSRYYDPVISRFINADSYGSTGQAFLGTNMFTYCNNNPIRFSDPSGNLFYLDDLFLACVCVVAVVVIPVAVVLLPPAQEIVYGITQVVEPYVDVLVETTVQVYERVTMPEHYQAQVADAKPVNLPARSKLRINMEHIVSGHMSGGSRNKNGNKTVFYGLTIDQLRQAIYDAYSNCTKLKTQGDNVLVRGYSKLYGIVIDMWVNLKDYVIETAFPPR